MQQLHFNFNVKPTKVLEAGTIAFAFVPETIEVTTGETSTLPDGSDVVYVLTKLRQTIDGGYIEQVRSQQLPVSIFDAIVGWNKQAMQPNVNLDALNQILLPFNLITI